MTRDDVFLVLKEAFKGKENERQLHQWAQIFYEDCIIKNDANCPDITQFIQRLEKGEPIQYIVRNARFYDLDLYVDENVLIPRPETEELVFLILDKYKHADEITLLDIGTGSGCIPLLLKKLKPQWEIYGCDISPEAIKIAQMNSENLSLYVQFYEADVFHIHKHAVLNQLKVDIIVSNPPYIPENEMRELVPSVKDYEPALALQVNDANSCKFYETIAEVGLHMLHKNGSIFCELHPDYAVACAQCFESYKNVEIHKDMQKKKRFLHAQSINA